MLLKNLKRNYKEKISKIPENKLAEPDIQIIASTLEASKYCVEKETLRYMFSTLITSSVNIDFNNIVHPSYIEILKRLSDFDAKLLVMIYKSNTSEFTNLIENNMKDLYRFAKYLSLSFSNLENLGLIYYNIDNSYIKFYDEKSSFDPDHIYEVIRDVLHFDKEHIRDEMNKRYSQDIYFCSLFSFFKVLWKCKIVRPKFIFC